MITKFVYETQEATQLSLPYVKTRKSKKLIPSGIGHIFTVRYDGELEIVSMCGKTKGEICEKTAERDTRIVSLPICLECANAWKKLDGSPWKKWAKSVAQ